MKLVGFFLLWLLGSAIAVSVAFAGVAVVNDELIDPPPAQVSNVGRTGTSTVSDSPDTPSPTTDNGSVRSTMEPDPQAGAASGQDVTPTAAATTVPSAEAEPADTATSPSPAPAATAVPGATTAVPATPQSTATVVPPTSVPAAPSAPAATAVPSSTPVPAPTTAPATSLPAATAAPTATAVPAPTPLPTATAVPTATAIPEPEALVLTFNLVGGSTAVSFSASAVKVLWASPNPGFEVDIDAGSNVRVEFESDDHRSRLDAWWSDSPQHEIREDQG